MATITKRGSGWFVQIRRKGVAPQFKTLPTKGDAQAWATEQEGRIAKGLEPIDTRSLRATTLGDILQRYGVEVVPGKRGAQVEAYRVARLRRTLLASVSLADLAPRRIAAYRDERLKTASRSTVRSELSMIRVALERARREWGYSLPDNPCALVTLPKPGDSRDRRLEIGELGALDPALRASRQPLLRPVVLFAIETAMRRGEMLALDWSHVRLAQRTAHLPMTKNGKPRTVPLTNGAIAVLEGLAHRTGAVFPINPQALRWAWDEARKAAGLADLRLHDLRHEGVSRFFDLGLSVPEVALISGHQDLRTLFRYTHMRPVELAAKLARLTSRTDFPS